MDENFFDASDSGVVLIETGGELIYHAARGLADREWATPMTVGARFNLASVSKLFTAVSIWMLVGEGSVDPDAPIGEHLPELAAHIAETVTVRQLYSHTSGLVRNIWDHSERSRLEAMVSADALALISGTQLQFDPGTKRAYSNAGFYLLRKSVFYEGSFLSKVLNPTALPYRDGLPR